MTDTDKIYTDAQPGDVISAELWREMQCRIYDDIRQTSEEAAAGIERVDQAGDSEKLGGQAPNELIDSIIDRVLDELRARSGYLKVFKILKVGETCVIDHDFGNCPLVDIYQLDYFPVVCSEDDGVRPSWATFYLYHTDDKKVRYPAEEGSGYPKGMIEIEPKDGPVYKIPFAEMLEKYKVEYTGSTTLGDLETEFYKAFFADPNDEFDDEQYCHSPWFHRCCREEKTVRKLKKGGDWDDLWIQFRPRKTINYPGGKPQADDVGTWQFLPASEGRCPVQTPIATPAPTQIQVCQYNHNRVGVSLLTGPVYPEAALTGSVDPDNTDTDSLIDQFGEGVRCELKVMILLKC